MPSLNTKLASAPNTTSNYVLKATSSTTIGNSLIFDNGTNVGIGTSSPANYFTTTLTIDGSSSQGIMFRASGTDRGFLFQDGSFIQLGSNTGGVIFKSNDTERMRITSGGQIGIGITPTGSWGLQMYGNGTASSVARIQLQNSSTGSADGDGGGISMEGIDFVTRNNESGVVKWELGGTERMRITSAGNLEVRGSTNSIIYAVGANNTFRAEMQVEGAGQFTGSLVAVPSASSTYGGIPTSCVGITTSSTPLVFAANNAERARITTGGILLVGGITSTSAYLDGFISVSVPSGTAPAACFKNLNADQFVASFWNNASSGDNIFVRFVSDSGASVRGTIFYSRANGVTRFDGQASGTYSDERLKDIKGEMTYGLDTINKIKTYDFNWRRNGNKGFGVKAQEICELIPEIVEKGNDGEIDPMEFQTTDIWKVNYNELVPVLIKSIQELNQKVEAQQQQINQLINK